MAEALKSTLEEVEILFITSESDLESRLFADLGCQVNSLKVRGLERRLSLNAIRAVFLSLRALSASWTLLGRARPHVVVGLGSYVSLPVVTAAYLRALPVVLHEQNTYPGLANRLSARMARAAALSWPGSERFFGGTRTVMTGNPVRKAVLQAKRDAGAEFFGLDPRKKTVLFFGGSQGAEHLNQAVVEALPELRLMSDLQVIHITGMMGFEHVQEVLQAAEPNAPGYYCYPYLEEMGLAYAAADLVVCRAGANTLAEITARGIPALLIPYPHATNNHQETNSRLIATAGGARVILDQDLSGPSLLKEVQELLSAPVLLKDMREKSKMMGSPGAAGALARLVIEVAAGAHQERRRR